MNLSTLPWYGWILFLFALSSTAGQLFAAARYVYKRDEGVAFFWPALLWTSFLYAVTP
jgi:hypothetical protein